MYAVMSLNKTVDINLYGMEYEVPLVFGEGMIGAIPVFATKEKAEEFANGKYEVLQLQTPNV